MQRDAEQKPKLWVVFQSLFGVLHRPLSAGSILDGYWMYLKLGYPGWGHSQSCFPAEKLTRYASGYGAVGTRSCQ